MIYLSAHVNCFVNYQELTHQIRIRVHVAFRISLKYQCIHWKSSHVVFLSAFREVQRLKFQEVPRGHLWPAYAHICAKSCISIATEPEYIISFSDCIRLLLL